MQEEDKEELYRRTQELLDRNIQSVVVDSRLVTKDSVFVATVGERVDGHRFIPDIYGNGALCAVSRQKLSDPAGPYLLVDDTLQALKDIAEAYRKKLSAKIVGITGSVGKTSTKEFIAGVLSEKYHVLKTEGNFNNEIGVPLTLLRIRREHEAAVVEMGISDFGEMRRLSKMARPDICVITNIGQSHLNNLIDRDGILRAKSEIFDYMAEDGEICLNGEDDKLAALDEIKGHRPRSSDWGKIRRRKSPWWISWVKGCGAVMLSCGCAGFRKEMRSRRKVRR